jgi:hypothetical protein
MLAKIIQQNIWPIAWPSDLILKRAQFVYAIHLHLPSCLCKHILGVMLEACDKSTAGLPFGCLLTQIILQSGINVNSEPKMKIQQSISSMQLAVHSIGRRVEQNQLDLLECLKYHHPSGNDDEDDADGILPMPEDV